MASVGWCKLGYCVGVVLLGFGFGSAVLDPLLHDTDGYPVDGLGDFEPARTAEVLKCPTDNLITSRHKCKVAADWVDCTRKFCCPDYVYISGRCVQKETDPCNIGLCEQKCAVYLQRVICTCYQGYRFNSYNQKNGIKPECEDINECLDKNGDCEHKCTNTPGSHVCACDPGYTLNKDGRTCDPEQKLHLTGPSLAAVRDKCYAGCDTVSRLQDRMRNLHEHVSGLVTAVRLSSFASGPPGPAGPQGPPGPPGPKGNPGTEEHRMENDGEDFSYNLLDSYVNTPNGNCRCQRGPIGAPGAPGREGPKGSTGSKGSRGPRGLRGSFDFLLLLLADLRHDIINLENKVYPKGDGPPKLNIQHAWRRQQMKDKARKSSAKEGHALEAFSAPVVEQSGVKVTSDGESGELERDSTKIKVKGDLGDEGYFRELERLISRQRAKQTMRKIKENMNPNGSISLDILDDDLDDDDDDDEDDDVSYEDQDAVLK